MARHNGVLMAQLRRALAEYERDHFPLPGIQQVRERDVFIKQVIDSARRVNYVSVIEGRPLNPRRADPNDEIFDPLRASIIHKNAGRFDEACWLVFLFTHFGKHPQSKWRYLQEIYGKLGDDPCWTWNEISIKPEEFRDWLRENVDYISRGEQRGFGGHRPYTSLDADKPAGTGAAIQSYTEWVNKYGGHHQLVQHALEQCEQHPARAFHWLYRAMREVMGFGRLAKFDYLTMLGKMKLAAIEPGHAYLSEASGPKRGARLMFQGSLAAELSAKELEHRVAPLAHYLGVGMQVIEDSLCNWQKHPGDYRYFKG